MRTPDNLGRRSQRGIGPLLTSSALIALIAGASVARGQSFQGNSSVSLGLVNISQGPGTTTLDVQTRNAVIDWTPTDTGTGGGAIRFQPAETTATFLTTAGLADYTVLNRIVPNDQTRAIRLDGNTLSQVAGGATGGSVWFYAPGGLIVGANARFDVGNLVLTTDPIDVPDGPFPTAATGITFGAASQARSAVVVEAPSASDRGIFAPNAGSYVAFVAPRIDQGGVVNVNGSVAYLAASAATVTVNAGLFSFTNVTGSQVTPGGETTLSHTGTTTGPAQAAATDNHTIYLVNVARNDAVTMLVSGNVGYQAATDASVVNGDVILGSGSVVTSAGSAFNPSGYTTSALGPALANRLSIGAGTYTSRVAAGSTGSVDVTTSGGDITMGLLHSEAGTFGTAAGHATTVAVAPGTTLAADGLTFYTYDAQGRATFDLAVERTGTLRANSLFSGGSLTPGMTQTIAIRGTAALGSLYAEGSSIGFGDAAAHTGGPVSVTVDGGALTVTGQTSLYSLARGGAPSGVSFDSTGGTVTVAVTNGGTADFANLIANGSTDLYFGQNNPGGTAQGGAVLLQATNNGVLTVAGALEARALAVSVADAQNAATATGGSVNVVANGGTIRLTAPTARATLDASASGGSATGGGISAYSANGGTLAIAGSLTATTAAENGDYATAAALGGRIDLRAFGGTTSVAGATTLLSSATSGGVGVTNTAAGYDATGNQVLVRADTGGTLTLGDLRIDDSAISVQNASIATGTALGGQGSITTTNGGNITIAGTVLIDSSANGNSFGAVAAVVANGGTALIAANTGSIRLTSTTAAQEVAADAQGGAATGGVAQVTVDGGGQVSFASGLSAHAQGFGGSATGDGDGGTGRGGFAQLIASDGTIAATALDIRASGGGGTGDGERDGGNGVGGLAALQTTGPNGAIATTGYVSLFAEGNAGAGGLGAATGIGGEARMRAEGGTITLAGTTGAVNLLLYAGGVGSAASTGGRAGDGTDGQGTGGFAHINASQGGTVAIAGNAVLNSVGTGGSAPAGGAGGAGVGGIASVGVGVAPDGSADGIGTIAAGTLQIAAFATGGAGGGGGGRSSGGQATIVAGAGSISGGTLDMSARNIGGAAIGDAVGGAAEGGTVSVAVGAGTVSFTNAGLLQITTGGAGGDATPGGAATGGLAQVGLNGTGGIGGAWSVTNAAIGGAGGAGFGGGDAGGTGGTATGGTAALVAANGNSTLTGLAITVTTQGGVGGAGGSAEQGSNGPGGAGGTGGAASGGSAQLLVSGGSLATGPLTVASAATGGTGGAGGNADPLAGSDVGGGRAGGRPRPAAGTSDLPAGGTGGAGGTANAAIAEIRSSGGTLTGAQTALSSLALAGRGGAGGRNAPDDTGTVTNAPDGTAGQGGGGGVFLTTMDAGTIALGDTTVSIGSTQGTVNRAGALTISAGAAGGSTPITLASLTATQTADVADTDHAFAISADAPIAVTGDTLLSGFVQTRFDATGPGQFRTGGTLTVRTLETIATQSDAAEGFVGISAGTASLDAAFGDMRIASIGTTVGDLRITGVQAIDIGFARSAANLAILPTASASIPVTAALTTTIGTAIAVGDVLVDGQAGVSVGSATAGRDVEIASVILNDDATVLPRDVTIGSATAGDDVIATAWGRVTVTGAIVTTGLGQDGTVAGQYADIPGSGVYLAGGHGITAQSIDAKALVRLNNYVESINGVQQADGTGGIEVGAITTPGAVIATSANDVVTLTGLAAGPVTASGTTVSLQAPGALTVASATATAGGITILAGDTLTITGQVVAATFFAANTPGAGSFTTIDAANDVSFAANGGALTGTRITTTRGSIDIAATGDLTVATLAAGNRIDVSAGGAALLGAITAGSDTAAEGYLEGDDRFGLVTVAGGGRVSASDVAAFGSILLDARGGGAAATTLTTGATGSVAIATAGTVDIGAVTTANRLYVGNPAALASLGSQSGNAAILAAIDAAGTTLAGGAATIGPIAAGRVQIGAGGDLTLTGGATAATTFDAVSGGSIDFAAVTAGDDLSLTAATTLSGTTATSTRGIVDLGAGGAIRVATIAAGNGVSADAGGTARFGSVTAGTFAASPANTGRDFGSIGLRAVGALSVDGALAYGSIGLASLNAGVTAQALTAGVGGEGNVAVLAAGPIALGTVAAPAQLLIGGPASIAGIGDDPTTTEVLDRIAANGLQPSGGDVTVSGAVRAGTARIFAGGGLTLTGGLATTGDATLRAVGAIAAGDVATGGSFFATAPDSVSLGTVTAGLDASIRTFGTVTATAVTAARDVDLVSVYATTDAQAATRDRTMRLGRVTAGDDASLGTFGRLTADAIVTTGLGQDGTGLQYPDTPGSGVLVRAGGGATIGAVTAAGSGTFVNTVRVIDGVRAADGTGGFSIGSAIVGTTLALTSDGGPISVAGIVAPGGVSATGTAVTLSATAPLLVTRAIATAGDLSITAPSLTLQTVSATGTTRLAVTDDLTFDTLSQAGGWDITTGGRLTGNAITSTGGAIALAAGGDATLGAIDAALSASVRSGGAIRLAAPLVARGGSAMLLAGTGIAAADIIASGTIGAASTGGAVTLGNLSAGTPGVGGAVMLLAEAGSITAGTVSAAAGVAAMSGAGAVGLGDVTSAGGVVRVSSAGDLGVGNVRAAGSIYLAGAGAITAGDLTAGVGQMLAGARLSAAGGVAGTGGGIASGFDQFALTRCDDCSTDAIGLPFAVNYFGNTYGSTYVSSNGYLTFGAGQSDFTPQGLGSGYVGNPILAAFFADVDTTSAPSAQITYGIGTYAGRPAFGANYNGVGYYDEHYDKFNRFQIVLTDRSDTGTGNFDVYYNYGVIAWETGDADNGINGFGGSSASVGYNAGIRGNPAGTYYSQPGSLVPGSFLDGGTMPLILATNTGVPGQLAFAVRNGMVGGTGGASPATISVTNLAAGNASAIRLGNLSAETVEVHGAGAVTVGAVATGDRGSGATPAGQPFATVLDASGGLVTGSIAGGGLIALGSRTGDVSTGALTTPGSVVVLADGAVALGAVTTGPGSGDALFVGGPDGAPAGFDFATLLSGTTFDTATLAQSTPSRIGGALTFGGPVTTGTLFAAATGPIAIGAATATGGLSLDTAGLIAIGGAIDGSAIALNSGDIAVAQGATIGSARTGSVVFVNTGEGASYVGDGLASAGEGAWSLSAAELAATHARDITIQAPADAVLGNVALLGASAGSAANLVDGEIGSFAVNAAGDIRLLGALAATQLQQGATVSLTANRAITGTLPQASVVLTGADGASAGTLSLAAPTIRFGTDAALAGLDTATLAIAEAQLATPAAGLARPDYLRAGTVRFVVGDALYTQNGGASSAIADRAGVRAGAGGIVISSYGEGANDARVILNARLGPDGAIVGGADGVPPILSASNGRVRFASGSRINGCPLDGTSCRGPIEPPVTPRQEIIDLTVRETIPVQDVIEQLELPTALTSPAAYTFATPALVSLVDLAPLTIAPLIDEPVTGAGNDDLWVGVGLGADREVTPLGGAKPGATPGQ